jgi:hypothetical protein
MRPIKSITGMGGGGIKENDGGSEFNYDILLRTLLDITMYLQHNNKKIKFSQASVAQACNPSYSEGTDQKGRGSKSTWANSLQDPISKINK